MTTAEFIIALFYRIDNQMCIVPKHPQAALYPSEVVTLGVLYALKGGSKRAFYRWLRRDWLAFFPRLPDCNPTKTGSSKCLSLSSAGRTLAPLVKY